MSKNAILVASSDHELADSIRTCLEHDGFDAVCVYRGRDGTRSFLESAPEAVILSDALPDMSGWEMAHRIRELSDAPILFILSRKDRFLVERALSVGDDYLAQPFSCDRLSIKLAVMLKRRAKVRSALVYDDGHLRVDIARRQVSRNGDPIHLSDIEFKLLIYFVRNPDRVLEHDELLRNVWGHTYLGAKSHVSLYVRYLRRKLEKDPAQPTYFCTEWGVGYSFRPHKPAPQRRSSSPV